MRAHGARAANLPSVGETPIPGGESISEKKTDEWWDGSTGPPSASRRERLLVELQLATFTRQSEQHSGQGSSALFLILNSENSSKRKQNNTKRVLR